MHDMSREIDIGLAPGQQAPAHLRQIPWPFSVHWRENATPADKQLYWDGQRLSLMHGNDGSRFLSLHWDWHSEWQHLRQQGGHLSGPLARALRSGKGQSHRLLDCTLGSGKDLTFFIAMGLEVVAYERHPMAFALAWDAWWRAKNINPEIWQRACLRYGDVTQVSTEHDAIDIIFCDPMYGEDHSTKARARLAMEVYHQLAGDDNDREQLWQWALSPEQRARKVILKRPLRASVFARPTAQFKGKSTRYDVYFK